MNNATQEIIYQLLAIIVSGTVGVVGMYAKAYIKNKMEKMDYEFDNSRVERILNNAVTYSEDYGKQIARITAKKLASTEKMDIAKRYISKVSPDVIENYGRELELMIDRKVAEKFGK